MKTTMNQLELTFGTSALPLGRLEQRSRRLARARWWFEQMHAAVDRALDGPAPVPPPPRQTGLELAGAP